MGKSGKGRARDKRPRVKEVVPASTKTPRARERFDSNSLYPSWRIAKIELVDPYGWHEIQRAKILDVRQKLASFEGRTWNEILIQSKKFNHSVPKDKLSKSARDRLAELRLDDVDELVSLRLSATERVWGIREEGVLRVLWWDPNHLVCPSEKKNT